MSDTTIEIPLGSVEYLYADLEAGTEPEQTMAFANHYPAHAGHPNSAATLALLLTAPANGKAYTLEDPFVARELERATSLPVTASYRTAAQALVLRALARKRGWPIEIWR